MKASDSRYPPIGGYAFLGDCLGGALVSSRGSIDWMCLPRLESPSVFAAVLDADRGGRFVFAPTNVERATRRYRESTAVLETRYETPSGVAVATECMVAGSRREHRAGSLADFELLRVIRCEEGEVEIEALVEPRPNYARKRCRIRNAKMLGWVIEDHAASLLLRSEMALDQRHGSEGPALVGRETLRAGEQRAVSLSHCVTAPGVLPTLGRDAEQRIDATARWWRDWSSRLRFNGEHGDAVRRSAITLKMLCFPPSGAIVAAPTTSLPATIGGPRNWDYRYCWLRDASLAMRALLDLGVREEADAFGSWLLHATRLTRPKLRIAYTVYGRTDFPERELNHLEGYRGSRPVRIGNAARNQRQLDTYGAVVDTAYRFVEHGGEIDRGAARMLVDFGKTVCRDWQQPDEGIWEIRSGQRQHTFSKVMCWVALDRLLRLDDEGVLKTPRDLFEKNRDLIRRTVEERGYNKARGAYTNTLDGDDLDASLFLLLLYGFETADSPRMRSTIDRIYEELGTGALVKRYSGTDDGVGGEEGAFGICCFWGVECLALTGRVGLAREYFDELCRHRNDIGLLSEEIDEDSGELLGNFPQAFSHIGLINAASTLDHLSEPAPSPSDAPREHAR